MAKTMQYGILLKLRDEVSAGLGKVQAGLKKFGDKISGASRVAQRGLLGVAGGVGAIVYAAAEAEEVEAKLVAVLKATKHAAGFTVDELKDIATQLEDITTYDDEAIMGLQTLLATFKEIKGDEFEDATKAALDMSTVLGQDLKSSALMLGKALNDPERGMSALREAGVPFTE